MLKTRMIEGEKYFTMVQLVIFALIGGIILLAGANKELFLSINTVSEYTGPGLWACLTILGDGYVTAVLLLLFINRKSEIVWSFIIATAIYMIILHSVKEGLDIRRPPGVLAPEQFNLIGPGYTHHAFPSGHTTTIFTLVQVIALKHKSTLIKILLPLGALLVAISRIAIGIHWPLDICAGAILGILAGTAGVYIAKKSSWGYSRVAQIIFYIILVPGALYMIFFYDTGYERAHLFMVMIGTGAIVYWLVDLLIYYNFWGRSKNK